MRVATLGGFTLLLLRPMDSSMQVASAQSAQPPSVAAAVARSLRTGGDDARALPFLTQARGAQSRSAMDEVADSLAAIAITASRDDLIHTRARAVAISTLHLAAKGEPGVAGVTRGISYAGAAERLQRIVETSHYLNARQLALKRLSEVNPTSEFSPYLRRLAIAPTGIAAAAVEILVDSRGEEGRTIARELYKANAIKNYEALWILQGKAAALGW